MEQCHPLAEIAHQTAVVLALQELPLGQFFAPLRGECSKSVVDGLQADLPPLDKRKLLVTL
jgi:hypothetical protein